MSYKYILYDVDDRGVATLTFNRPEKLNATNSEMQAEIVDAVQKTDWNPKAKILVLTGAGKAFGSGMDLKDLVDAGNWSASSSWYPELGAAFPPHTAGLDRPIRNMNKITIAAVNGIAAGVFCDMTLNCDFRIASEKGSFWEPYYRLMPPSAGTWYLPRMVGLQKAFSMLVLGEKIDAQEAYRIGLVYKTVPHEELMNAVEDLIGKLLKLSPAVLQHSKRSILNGLEQDFVTTMEYIRYTRALCGHLGIIEEAAMALIEKRAPNFKH